MTPSRSMQLLFSASVLALCSANAALADDQAVATAKPVAIGASAKAVRSTETLTADAAPAPADNSLQAIVVTGSRLTSAGFTAPTPVTVLGQAAIEKTAPADVYDIVKQIPSFRPTAGPGNTQAGIRTAGQAILDLRGLNYNRTLVLIDGLRPTPVNSQNLFDTNMVPASLIDHVDVVTGGASAAYGSDAIAGVVNLVLKHHAQGFFGNVQYSISQHSDGKEPLISLGYGTAFADNRGHFIIGGDFDKDFGVNSVYDRKWGALEPGLVSLPANRTPGLPANLITNHSELSNNSAGGIINSGPLKGIAFDANGNPFQLQIGSPAGATQMVGTGNIGSTNFPGQQIMAPFRRAAAMTRIEYDLTPDITAFGSVSYGSVHSYTNASSFSPTDIVINSQTNPFVPASVKAAAAAAGLTNITLSKIGTPFNNIGPYTSGNRLDHWDGAAGLSGKFGGTWKWSASFSHGWTDSTRAFKQDPKLANFYAAVNAVVSPTGAIVCGPAATNPNFAAAAHGNIIQNIESGCQPYNVFGYNTASSQSVAYIQGTSNVAEMVKQDYATSNLSGELFNLPAGPVSVAFGLEYRMNSINSVAGYNSIPFYVANENNISYSAAYHTKEAYGEAEVPLVKDAALAKSLSLNGAVRETDYSNFGGVTTWKVGGVWEPNDDFRFRLTRSRDIRAPNLNELYNPGSNGSGTILYNGTSAFAASFNNGNPNLKPEVADTWTGGVAFQPTWEWLRGFRASVDYFKITVNGVIASLTAQDIVNRCSSGITQFCSLIDFNNSALGIAAVHMSPLNLSALKTDGFDIEIAYRVPIDKLNLPGSFSIRALGTRTNHLQILSPLPNGTITTAEYAGTASSVQGTGGVSGGQPYWSWNTDFLYSVGRFSVNMNVTYTSPVKYNNTLIGPDDPGYSPTLANSINDNKFPATLYFNPTFNYDIIQGSGRRLQAYLRINNLLDKNPPLVGILLTNGGNPYDLVGRYFKAGLRFAF